MRDRYIKYKTICRLTLAGDDDINNTSGFVYPLAFPISSVTINNVGSGFGASIPVITFSGGNPIIPAQAIATNSSGSLGSITLLTGGSGYQSIPSVFINNNPITGTQNLVGGSGYTSTPTVTINGNGTGATAYATVISNVITAISISSGGGGYTNATITISGGGGSGASASPIIANGAIATAVSNNIINAKRMKFTLNNALNSVKLSQNARLVIESCNIPGIANMISKYVMLRMVTSSQDKTFDTKKLLNGNPIILAMAIGTTVGGTNILYNASEFFYNINVPSNFLEKGYVELELECPSQTTASIDFLTGSPLNAFFINFVIIDEDLDETDDITLAPRMNSKLDHMTMPLYRYK